MSDGRFNGIAVLDAIPEGEPNTARRVREDLRDISDYKVEGLHVLYFRIESAKDLQEALADLRHKAVERGLKPWLHLEAHGLDDEQGFVLAGGEPCTWRDLKEMLIPLNVATELNLLLFLAACYGGSFARAIETTDRAPVLGLVGPTQEIMSGDLEVDFKAFYQTFFATQSLRSAMDALTHGGNVYYRATAESFFYDVWASYKRDHCTPGAIRCRAQKLYRKIKERGDIRVPGIASLERLIHSKEMEQFDKFRDTYFMYDLGEGNRYRFPVTYKKAEEAANKALQPTRLKPRG